MHICNVLHTAICVEDATNSHLCSSNCVLGMEDTMEKIFTENNFTEEVLQSDKPVLVDFYADWCNPCKMMAPVVEEIAKEYEGKVVVGKLNIDDAQKLAFKYKVMSIPTMILFKNGEVAGRIVGVVSKSELEDMIK